MKDIARECVNEAHRANAILPHIQQGHANIFYISFPNYENSVVKTEEADKILEALLSNVKDGGYIIVFGHTPVLLSSANFKCLDGFQFQQSIGVSMYKTGIF